MNLILRPRNDLEEAVERKFVWIQSAREWLQSQPGALAARMSGSGSTVFGLWPTLPLLQNKPVAHSAAGWSIVFSWIMLALPRKSWSPCLQLGKKMKPQNFFPNCSVVWTVRPRVKPFTEIARLVSNPESLTSFASFTSPRKLAGRLVSKPPNQSVS